MTRFKLFLFPVTTMTILTGGAGGALPAADLSTQDQRGVSVQTLNTPRSFPKITNQLDWSWRARRIQEQVLVSCGLWPLPERTPLQAHIFGRIEHEDYTVEKVHLQTYPGFYLGGNLYRPRGQTEGPFPGILNPHGHWSHGRLEDVERGSIAARCIQFARLGMVAFSYDMAGYNDTDQVNHKFASDPIHQLWNISLMGLQTWNSIRALDFLESLPDVDPKRLACTGASGGGTQTFMLGAVDRRLAAVAPMVMVSHSMQGGCLCENAPGLRVSYSNMEIAAAAAPIPQLLVAATGDWTKKTMEIEGPALAGVYDLFQARDRLRFVLFDSPHNYNQRSREEAYRWFARWLLQHPNPDSIEERPYRKEPNQSLLVWSNLKRPDNALNESQLIQYMVSQARAHLEELHPETLEDLDRMVKPLSTAWQHLLHLSIPASGITTEEISRETAAGYEIVRLHVARSDVGRRLPVVQFTPPNPDSGRVVILAHAEGKSAFLNEASQPRGLAKRLLSKGYPLILFDAFLTGELADAQAEKKRSPFENHFSTYNRTDLLERVLDLVTICHLAERQDNERELILCGVDRAGLWALLAGLMADVVIADCAKLDMNDATQLLEQDLFIPGLLRYGGFDGAAALAAPGPMLLHNTGKTFPLPLTRAVFQVTDLSESLKIEKNRLSDRAIARWIGDLKKQVP